MRILEEIGILFLNDEALRILKDAGCDVDMDTQRVRMDRAFVMEQVKKAPTSFAITPRNPERKVHGRRRQRCSSSTCRARPTPWTSTAAGAPATRDSFRDFMKLTQYFNCIHLAGGYPVEPIDIHASVRHLDAIYDKLTLTDKVVHAYSLGTERVEDAMEMVRIAARPHATRSSRPRRACTPTSTPPRR